MVNDGLAVIAIVPVEEKRTLAPAVKNDTGELKKLFQLVEEAVRGKE